MATKNTSTKTRGNLRAADVTNVVHSIAIHDLYSDPEQNWGRKYTQTSEEGKLKELRDSLAQINWRANDRVEAREMTPEEVTKYHAMLMAELAELEAAASVETAGDEEKLRLRIWKLLRCDGHGKARKPRYLVMTGNQRFSQVIWASMDRYKIGSKEGWGALGVQPPKDPDTGEDLRIPASDSPESWIISRIPMEVRTYVDELDQICSQVEENGLKLVGNQEMDRLDLCMAGQKVLKLMYDQLGRLPTEAEFGRQLRITKRGQKQDIYAIVLTDWYGGEELDYINRCCIKDVADPRYINWAWRWGRNWDVKNPSLSRRILSRMDPSWVEAERKRMKANGKDEKHSEWPEYATHAEFVEWFNWRPEEDHVKTQRLNHDKMGEEATKFGANVLEDFVKGARDGSLDEFWEKYKGFNEVFNVAFKLGNAVGTELLGEALAKLLAAGAREATSILEELMDRLDLEEEASIRGRIINDDDGVPRLGHNGGHLETATVGVEDDDVVEGEVVEE